MQSAVDAMRKDEWSVGEGCTDEISGLKAKIVRRVLIMINRILMIRLKQIMV